MDLVKIGFQINANGLKDANKELDNLLAKADKLNALGNGDGQGGGSGGSGTSPRTKKLKDETNAADKMIQKQQTINQLLPYMDKGVANLASSFWLVSKEAQSFNKYLDLLESNKAITEQKKQVEGLAKEQAKASASEEVARQKRLLAEQNYYLRVQEEAKKAVAKEKALQQKAIDDAEKARQQSLLRVQNNYIKQQEAIAKAQQKAIDKQIASQNALNESNQKAITLEQAKAKYVSQGYGKTDSTRLARLEVSGADVTTLNNYKSAIEATTRATQALNPAVEKVTTSHSNFLDQVKGIAIYAALSAAIYGVMTAMTNLAVATVKMADEYTSIQNRMKLYINDSQTLATVNRNLGKMAMENNVGLRETATLYTRLAPALQKLGGNAATVTAVVDAFGKSMRIGGATAQEAASATIQFSQAMASGKLAGDEFRSISEASPRFLKAIADGSGIATESLKKLSSEGFLTTSLVARALLKEYPKLIEENKKLGATMEQGANAIKTGFLVAIGEFNEGAGITKALGEAMLDLAQGMFTGAQNARQFGKDVNDWFSANAGTISTVVDAFKLLAVIIATRYVVAVVLATKESILYQRALIGMAAQQANVTRSATIMTLAISGVSTAMKGVLGFFGGWAGIALTIAGVATSYLLLRDNAAEASKKLVESSEYADMTTNSFKQLNAEQQKNARASLIKSMSDVNEKLDEQANTVNRVLLSYVQLRQMQGKMNNKQLDDVINKTTKGLMDYDTAYRKLLELGAPTNVVEEFKKQKDVYNETAKSAKTLETSANAAGAGVKLAGNEAQNASPAIRGLKNDMDGLGDASISAADKFKELVNAYIQGAADIRTSLKVSQQYGLEQSLSDRVIKEAGILADSNEKIKSQTSSINKMREAVAKLSAEDQKRFKKQIEQIDKLAKSNKDKVAGQYIAQLAPYAQQLQASQNERSSFDASRKDEDKSQDNLLKKREDVLASYQDQVDTVDRIQQLLAKGVGYEVAKVAATKDYYENITGTMLAQEVILAQQTQKRLEYLATLSEEEDIQTRAILLQQKGASYAQSRALAEAGFREDADGLLTLQKLMTNELYAQHYSLDDQLSWYTSINKMLKDGVGLEEATTRATFSRLESTKKGLSDSEKSLMKLMLAQQKNLKLKETERQVTLTLTNAEKQRVAYVNAQAGGYANLIKNMAIANKIASDPTLSPDQAKKLVEAEELTNYEKELAELKRQTYIATLNESEAVKTLVGNYSTMDSVQIGTLANQQRLLEIAKELAEEAEKQKNPLGDFSNVDFSVFGDFGNPFQSALDGMNELIRTTTEGGEIIKQLTEEIDAAKIMGLDTADRELELGKRTEKQANDKKKATDKAITSGLSLTKSLFKEESKGYKVVSGMEKAYQASKIAFALWEKKDTIKTLAIKVAGYAKDMITFIGGVTSKIAAQMGLNVVQAQGAVASAAQAPPPVGFASAAAMIALMAGIGIAISSGGSSGGSYVDTSNQGTGTVFGDSEAQSASIANSIDLLSENSDLMLPLTSAMLRSLRNIESNIGGLTNLLIRTGVGKDFNIAEGFQQNSTGKYLGMAGQLAGGVGGAIGGGLLGSFGAGLLGAGMGSALGIGLGVLTGGIGLLLGSALGSMLGGLFGTKTTVKGQGLFGGDQKLGDILSEGFNLQEYVDVNTKKKALGITTSNKSSTKYSKADAELSNQFTLIFGGFYDSILSATDALGFDLSKVSAKLSNHIVSLGKINLKGLNGEQIQEKLEAVFGSAADSIARAATNEVTYVTETVQQPIKALFGKVTVGYRTVTQTVAVVTNVFDDFQKVGEGFFETVVRVATGVEQAAYFTDRLNVTAIKYVDIINKQGDVAAEIVRQSVLLNESTKDIKGGFYDLVNSFDGTAEELTDFVLTLRDLQDQLFMTGKNADYLTSAMILGAGGLDSLASGLDAYFEMLSPAEQAAELTRRLTNEFAIFGKELPADVKAFRNLVSSIDITTEAGQKLYGQILALAPEFNDLQDALDSANSEVNALVQSLRDLAEQARAARGETEQPRNLAYTRSQFEQASVLAMQGDTEAANRLLTLGKDLMQVSKLYALSGSEYAKDLALIQRAATVSADVQENGLGTSISPTLTPSNGTGTTTPTIATTNSTMTTELQGMREELNAGLFAIAKFVQNVDSRTERWDDGNRVMVGIQPENGDTPVPVVVTP